MMAMKARLMGDDATYALILAAATPPQAKILGRQVKKFVPSVWDANCDAVVERGNWLKFNPESRLDVHTTGNRC